MQRNRIVYCRRSGRGEVIHSPYHGRFAQLLLDSAELLLEGMAPPGAVSAGLKVLHLDLAYCNRPLPDAPAESPGSQLVYLDEGATDDEVRVFELRDRKSTPEAEVSYRQLSTVLRTEIRRLPPLLRGVLEMRDLRELSTERGRRTDRDLDRRRQVAPDARPRGVEVASGTPPRYRPGELSF